MIVDEEVSYFLEHFGVRGMQWGIQKKSNKSKSNSTLSQTANRNLKIAAASGGVVAVGALFVAKHMASSSGRTPVSRVPTMIDTNPNHAKQASLIRANMNRMYADIASDFRQTERTIDPRSISDSSAYRWPRTFGA